MSGCTDATVISAIFSDMHVNLYNLDKALSYIYHPSSVKDCNVLTSYVPKILRSLCRKFPGSYFALFMYIARQSSAYFAVKSMRSFLTWSLNRAVQLLQGVHAPRFVFLVR